MMKRPLRDQDLNCVDVHITGSCKPCNQVCTRSGSQHVDWNPPTLTQLYGSNIRTNNLFTVSPSLDPEQSHRNCIFLCTGYNPVTTTSSIISRLHLSACRNNVSQLCCTERRIADKFTRNWCRYGPDILLRYFQCGRKFWSFGRHTSFASSSQAVSGNCLPRIQPRDC